MKGYRLTTLGKVVLFSFLVLLILSTAYTIKAFIYHLDNSKLNITSNNIMPGSKESKVNVLDEHDVAYAYELTQSSEVDFNKLENTELTVYFEPDSDIVKNQYYKSLDIFANVADILKDFNIEIEGNCATLYTDVSDNKNNIISYNLSLSRAKAVSNYLQEKGIDSNRINVTGNGSSKPVKDNTTEEGRSYNRRVEISFKLK